MMAPLAPSTPSPFHARRLSDQEIEQLASRASVDAAAVRDFLSTAETSLPEIDVLHALHVTARQRNWSNATVTAARIGIANAFRRPVDYRQPPRAGEGRVTTARTR